MIWLVFALLSVVGLLFMGLPLRHRSSRTPVPADATDAVLMDQLDEVRRDLERGVISDTEATAAEQEIKRRILVQSRRSSVRAGLRFWILLRNGLARDPRCRLCRTCH